MTRPRVLVIGLDAAEPALLRRWAASGHMPTLARLIATGASGPLETPSRQFPDCSFFSAYTGLGPASLGRYFFIQPRPGTTDLRMLDHGLPHGEPFWVAASRQGRRCIAVDTPKLELRPPRDGIHLVGWGMHGSSPPLASSPQAVARDVVARHGRYPHRTCDNHGRSDASYRRLLRGVRAGVDQRRRILLDLLRERADLFFAVFAETHCVGHQFWHFLDPAHPLHRADAGDDLGNAMRDVYAAIDKAIGELIDAAGPQARVILFSTQGMRPQYHGRDLIPTLLRLWGMAEPVNRAPDPRREVRLRAAVPLLGRARDAVPLPLQYLLKRGLPAPLATALVCRFMGTLRLESGDRAYQVPNNEMTPTLRISLAGREPAGRVAPGDEYRQLCDFLAQRMRELVNPATGRAALAAVDVIDDVCRGDHRDVLPDVSGYWSPEAPIAALYSPGYGTVVGAPHDYRTGGHAPDGFLCLSHATGALQGADIRDVAPTVLHLLGLAPGDRLEGRPLLR